MAKRHKLSGPKKAFRGRPAAGAGAAEAASRKKSAAPVIRLPDDDDDDDDDAPPPVSDSSSEAQDEPVLDDASSSSDSGELRWGRTAKGYYKEGESESEGEEEEYREAVKRQGDREKKLVQSDFAIPGASEDENDERPSRAVVSSRPEAEKPDLQLLATEAPEVLALLGELQTNTGIVSQVIQPILERLRLGEASTSLGVSYLETRLHLLLSYTLNVAFYLLLRAESGGARAESHPVVAELVRLRATMDKLRPLDAKLKHQLDELIQSGQRQQRDADEEEDEPEAPEPAKSKRAPALEQLETPDEALLLGSSAAPPPSRREKKDRKRLAQVRDSDLLHGLQAEFSEAPLEVVDEASRLARSAEGEQRRRYEEENFTRLPETKKERGKRLELERKAGVGAMDFVSSQDFRAIEALLGQREDGDEEEDGAKPVGQAVKEMGLALRAGRAAGPQGDDNVAPRAKAAAAPSYAHDDEAPPSPEARGDNMDNDLDEDNFYAQVKADKKRQRQERQDAYAFPERFAPEPGRLLDEGAPRQATRAMIKNRGLTPHKPKDAKNPRKHIRDKYEKKLKARKGQVRSMRAEGDAYQGEASGIRSRLVRSRVAAKV